MKKNFRRALVSVYNKDRLIEVGTALHAAGVEILSTGSTSKNLVAAGIPVTEVSDYTGFPEIMDGRVKSLHPRIHAGILADQDNPDHLAAIAQLDIAPLDLVIINLYPFAQTIAAGATFEDSIEQIDIGGPAMLRAAAKNHSSVAVISDPSQYDQLLSAISSGGFTDTERRQLAVTAFRNTAEYDVAIATWLAATDTKPGILLASDPKLSEIVAQAKQQVDILVMSFHFGNEYSPANTHQEKLAHTVIDAGADIVVGHHPHVMEKVEEYKGKPIFYSLGNFIFDQYFSQHTMRGMVATVSIDPETKAITHTQQVSPLSKQYVPGELVPFTQDMLITKAFTP